MAGNSIGRNFVVTPFGESHGPCIGVLIDGCPAGLELSKEDIQPELDRRKPGQSQITTSRSECDKVELLSGTFDGKTTGAPICMAIWNTDVISDMYYDIDGKGHSVKIIPRPGHADYTAQKRYKGYSDFRGGGRFSGRITASFVMAGAIAKKLLEKLGVEIFAHTIQIEDVMVENPITIDMIRQNVEKNPVRCADPVIAEFMVKKIEKAKSSGDSIGSMVEGIAINVPPGLGDPIWDSIEGDLSKYIYSIPGVKSVEFGLGSKVASMTGTEFCDPYIFREGKVVTQKNFAGGISGGITNGMPIRCRIAFKPPSPIRRNFHSVNLLTMKEVDITAKSPISNPRDDPSIAPRVVPVVEAVMAICLLDHAMRAGLIGLSV